MSASSNPDGNVVVDFNFGEQIEDLFGVNTRLKIDEAIGIVASIPLKIQTSFRLNDKLMVECRQPTRPDIPKYENFFKGKPKDVTEALKYLEQEKEYPYLATVEDAQILIIVRHIKEGEVVPDEVVFGDVE